MTGKLRKPLKDRGIARKNLFKSYLISLGITPPRNMERSIDMINYLIQHAAGPIPSRVERVKEAQKLIGTLVGTKFGPAEVLEIQVSDSPAGRKYEDNLKAVVAINGGSTTMLIRLDEIETDSPSE